MVKKLSSKHLRKIKRLPVTSLVRHSIRESAGIRLEAQNTSNKKPFFFVFGRSTSWGDYDYGKASKRFDRLVKLSKKRKR